MKRSIAAIAAALVLASSAARAGAPDGPHAATPANAYAQLLERYVRVVSPPDEPLVTRFDYAGLRAAADGRRRLERIKEQLLLAPPAKMTPRARLAWAINSYNFLVLRAVTEHLDEADKGESGASVLNITIGDRPFFEAPLVAIEGESYSLNAFERRFVFLGFDPKAGTAPPATLEPQAHFALVCGAIGCPPLLPRPYAADSLDAQLDFVTRAALASPVHLRWNTSPPRLEASSVFAWYEGDFGGPDEAFAFLLRHAPAATRTRIHKAGVKRIAASIEWDWSLNQAPAR